MKKKVSAKGEQQPTVDHKEELLSPSDFARHLRVCNATVRRLERRGLIKGLRLNRRLVRYPASELRKLLANAA
jgi:predicted site-specific integrase-resolvase